NYLKGCLLTQRGYYYDAQKYIETACYLDPNNAEYQQAKNRLRYQSGSFGGSYRTGTGSTEPDCCSICTTLIVLDACCDCCGAAC
ncbi:MAG: molecular chaperone DnaJ, partial [Clostridia bacterium]|nr:molecular chaperone DnaJ [Clostridia bacterium]